MPRVFVTKTCAGKPPHRKQDTRVRKEQQPRSASRHVYTSRDLSGVVIVSLTVDGLEVTFSMRGFGRNSRSF